MARFNRGYWPIFALVAIAASQDITPSNNSALLQDQPEIEGLTLELAGGLTTHILPSTVNATAHLPDNGLTGYLFFANDTTQTNLTSGHIAYISCDAKDYPDNIQGRDVVAAAIEKQVTAILLFSRTSDLCTYSDGPQPFEYVYSMVDPTNAGQLLLGLNVSARFEAVYAQIRRTATTMNNGTSGSTGSGTTHGDSFGPSPTTAVAMIILYSITGVITALFLVIIITGALRAHRHPERYGPRDVLGRPRQSRARGIARAMLDTIPIVKFGEREPPKPADVELGEPGPADSGRGTPEAPRTEEQPPSEPTSGRAEDAQEGVASGIAAAETPRTADPSEGAEEALGCSICTDDFEKGQDIRVLPCDHKFHPACIDPWLLNVSGTCPLCRIDLHPTTSRTTEGEHGAGGPFPLPLNPQGDSEEPSASRRRSTFKDVLNLRRLLEATQEERLAALRGFRERQNRESSSEDTAEARRRRRLTARLQDAFSIRTRRNDPAAGAQEQRPDDSGAGHPGPVPGPSLQDETPGDQAR